MPRTSRVASKSGMYHIMFRGNELRDIFIDNEDRTRFLQVLIDKAQKETFNIYAYCLMDNHVHLLVGGCHEKLGHLKRINTSYVYYFNKKYGRIGHLFHDRYKSEPVEADSYFLEVVRYIHNNPIKAGITKTPEEYLWSSYSCYIDDGKRVNKSIDAEYVLSFFVNGQKKAVEQFKEFSKKEYEGTFIEIAEKETQKSIKGELATRQFIEEYLKMQGIGIKDLKLKLFIAMRNELIGELKSKSDQSDRDLARILDINRGAVQKVCQRTVP